MIAASPAGSVLRVRMAVVLLVVGAGIIGIGLLLAFSNYGTPSSGPVSSYQLTQGELTECISFIAAGVLVLAIGSVLMVRTLAARRAVGRKP